MDAHGLLDLIAAEGAMFDSAIERPVGRPPARNSSRQRPWRSTRAGGILEHVALLRREHPEHAEALAQHWRQILLLVHQDERKIVDEAAGCPS